MKGYEDLIERCLGKDEAAWQDFVRKFRPLVHWSVRRRLKDIAPRIGGMESEDITQEVFVSIWENEKLSTLRDPATLKSWLVMISLNAASDHIRKKRFKESQKTISLAAPVSSRNERSTLEDIIRTPQADACSMAHAGEVNEAISKSIESLPPRDRLVFRFYVTDGRKQTDIARIMNMPHNTVGTIISRAREKIKKELKNTLGIDKWTGNYAKGSEYVHKNGGGGPLRGKAL